MKKILAIIKGSFEFIWVLTAAITLLPALPILLPFIMIIGYCTAEGFNKRFPYDNNHLQPDSTCAGQGCTETESDL